NAPTEIVAVMNPPRADAPAIHASSSSDRSESSSITTTAQSPPATAAASPAPRYPCSRSARDATNTPATEDDPVASTSNSASESPASDPDVLGTAIAR